MRAISFCACLLLLATVGCGGSPDSLVKEQIQLMNEMATAMEKDAPQAELDKFQSKSDALSKRFDALGLTDSEKTELISRHQTELTAAATRLQKAMMQKAMNSLGDGFPGMPPGGMPSFNGN